MVARLSLCCSWNPSSSTALCLSQQAFHVQDVPFTVYKLGKNFVFLEVYEGSPPFKGSANTVEQGGEGAAWDSGEYPLQTLLSPERHLGWGREQPGQRLPFC